MGNSKQPINLGKVSSISSGAQSNYITPSPPPRINNNKNKNNEDVIISMPLPVQPAVPSINDKKKNRKRKVTEPELPESDDSDADPSLYRLQHEYLDNEVNEDEDEREAMLLDDKDALNETLQNPTDDGLTTKGQKTYVVEDSMTKE